MVHAFMSSAHVTVLDLDELVEKVKEDAWEPSDVMVRIIEMVNVRMSSRRNCCKDKREQGNVCLKNAAVWGV